MLSKNKITKSTSASKTTTLKEEEKHTLTLIEYNAEGGTYKQDTWYSGTVKGVGSDNLSPITMSYTVEGADASKKQEGKILSREIKNEKSSNIKYQVVDDAGNSVTGIKYIIKLDRTAPTKPVLSRNPGKWVNKNFKLTGTTRETMPGVSYWQYSYDKKTWKKYSDSARKTFTLPTFSAEQNRNIYIRIVDKVGNISPNVSS